MTMQDDENVASQALEAGNYEEAIRMLNLLAERNSHYALLSLGWIYETGTSRKIDKVAAQRFYERAIAEGSMPAYFELGRLLVSQGEDAQARLTFEAGAERGDVPCMARLGRMMVEGRGGPADVGVGSTRLESAAAAGHIHAQRALLAIEERNAQSMFEKLSVKRKVALLVKRGAQETLKDPHSDKVR
jgi:TPR repeat protein